MTKLHAGSVADRAVKHLQSLPAGTELSGNELSEAIDCERKNLSPLLFSAIKGGLIAKRVIKGRELAYSDGARPSPKRVRSVFDQGDAAAAEAPPEPRSKKAKNAKNAMSNGLAHQPTPPASANHADPSTWKAPATSKRAPALIEVAPPSVEIAIFNTGTLLIEASGQPPLRLSRDQTRELVAYLRRIDGAIIESLQ